MNFSEDEKEGYDNHLKWLRIQTNTIKNYEKNAREEGATNAKINIAQNLLKINMNIEQIIAVTGLTREEILAINKP